MVTERTTIEGTLHLLLISPRDWDGRLAELAQVWQPNDQLLLMGSAVQGHASELLLAFAENRAVGLYAPDAAQIPIPDTLPNHLQRVSSVLWATWTLEYVRCMTWRSVT